MTEKIETPGTAKINRQWRLVARPVGLLKASDFSWRESPIAAPRDGEILVRNIYLSIDPAIRGWAARQTYMPPVALGDVMRGFTIGVVEQSRNGHFQEGSFVRGSLGWQDYAVSDGTGLTILPKGGSVPLPAWFGFLGHVGLTAYFGMLDIGKPKPGETLVVSAAAGAVGSVAGQIGKIKGCRVVGIAGSEEKCDWIKTGLGFDAAINYKTESVRESLKKHCPNGIDIYFENVGGEILDAVLSLINVRARVVVCGLIAQSNATEPTPGPFNFYQVLTKRARIEGILVLDYMAQVERAEKASAELIKWYEEGRLKYRVEVIAGLENAPAAVNKIFDGSSKGKLVVKM